MDRGTAERIYRVTQEGRITDATGTGLGTMMRLVNGHFVADIFGVRGGERENVFDAICSAFDVMDNLIEALDRADAIARGRLDIRV